MPMRQAQEAADKGTNKTTPMNAIRRVSLLTLCSTALMWAGLQSTCAQMFGPYLKVDGGANIVADNDIDIGGTGGTLSLDTGYRVDGAVGYQFGRWVALELEGGYADNAVDKLTMGPMVAKPQDSRLTQIPVLASLVVRFENQTDWVPYIGAGAGGVMTSLKISGDEDKDAAFAWQGKIGVIYKIEEQAWLDAGYKLLVASEQDFHLGGSSLQTKELFNHFFGISVVWKF